MRTGRRWRALLGLGCGLLGSGLLQAAPVVFEARVSRVSDGDTVWVVPDADVPVTPGLKPHKHKPVKLRLVGIDAPERCQAHGEEATRALGTLVLGQRVTVRRRATDDYGRALGTLRLNGQDVAARLVREGHAWSARHFDDPGPYAREERAARAARRGLFAQRAPQMPKDFRREHGPCPPAAPGARGSKLDARSRHTPPNPKGDACRESWICVQCLESLAAS